MTRVHNFLYSIFTLTRNSKMNIPTEPDQCEKSHKEIKITLLANSGAPWKE